ncbi:flippase [Clostridium sp. Marseille-P299]|uniref:flippase n=1 Tax=Clostridium sp. Marseille-P299 TaxID=1805477 RepID=UPI000834BD74|nr:flippase [Clostridium sp. Marseille-P299]
MNRLKKNLFYNVIYQILILIVPFITTPYVSRVFLADGLGTYSVTSAIAKYFWLFALLGMANYGNRTISISRKNKDDVSKTFWNLFYFQAIISTIIFIAYLIYVVKIGYKAYNIISICQIPYVLSAFFEISWFFYGTEQFRFMVIRNAIIKVVTTILIFALVRTQNDVWIYTLINAISTLAGQVLIWPFLLKNTNFVKPNWEIIKGHFKPNCILFVSVVAVSIYTLMDKIMIELLSTRSEVGYYENTEKILNMCNSITGAIGAVMLPRISYLMGKKDDTNIYMYLAKSMKYIMLISIAMSFGIAGIGKEFAIVFFGKEFAACGTSLIVISVAIMFYSWENILRTQYLLPGCRDNIFVKGTIYAAITNLILNSIFIPKLGALGAVIGTAGAQFSAAFYQSISVRKELPIISYIRTLIPFIFFGEIMFIYCRIIGKLFGSHILTVIVQVLGGAIIFSGLSLVYLVLEKDPLIINMQKKLRNKLN